MVPYTHVSVTDCGQPIPTGGSENGRLVFWIFLRPLISTKCFHIHLVGLRNRKDQHGNAILPPRNNQLRDIKTSTDESPCDVAARFSIDIDVGPVIDAVKVQPDALAIKVRRHIQLVPIPPVRMCEKI